MKTIPKLADFNHPLVIKTATELTDEETTVRGKLEKLFYYVRDDIEFGFPLNGDLTSASYTIKLKMGQCNTKGTLFLAMCKAVGIPGRMHFSLIEKRIQQGLFTGPMFRLMPDKLSHGWIEVQVDDKWRRIDAYINDQDFYEAGKQELKKKGWDTGYSIACSSGESSIELNIDEEAFVQMDAVVEDQGVWDDPADYYATEHYKNRPNAVKLFIYRLLIGRINRRIGKLRNSCEGGICGIPLSTRQSSLQLTNQQP